MGWSENVNAGETSPADGPPGDGDGGGASDGQQGALHHAARWRVFPSDSSERAPPPARLTQAEGDSDPKSAPSVLPHWQWYWSC